jgi:hypothetical protein
MGLIKNIVFCALFLMLSAPLSAADLDDLFDVQKLSKHLKATPTQQETIATHIPKLTAIIAGYQITRAKKLCEATLWQGHIPRIKTLRTMRKATLDSVDATIASLKELAQFNEKQNKNLDKLLKGNDNILDYPIAKHPYHHVINSPVIKDFLREKHAYRITLPSHPTPNNTWTYAQLLETWTARGFIPTLRPIDDLQHAPDIASSPDLQTRVLPQAERARIVKSPLLISATLLVPDLGKAEFDLLKTNYAPDSVDVTTWDEYVVQNQMENMIQVRLKLNTPFNEKYLDLNRWIIFLEDADGVGYEPRQVEARAFYPLEAVEVSVPGREIEVTDVFGQYFSPIPGEKERFYLEAPSRMTYVGNEKLLQLYFPGRDFQGNPIVDEKTKFLKLIVQSQETDFGRSELIWRMEKPQNKVRPPKG